MLMKLVNEVSLVVSAKLTHCVEYRKRGHWVTVDPGTEFTLDVDNNIGLINGDHVKLDISDYTVLMSN